MVEFDTVRMQECRIGSEMQVREYTFGMQVRNGGSEMKVPTDDPEHSS